MVLLPPLRLLPSLLEQKLALDLDKIPENLVLKPPARMLPYLLLPTPFMLPPLRLGAPELEGILGKLVRTPCLCPQVVLPLSKHNIQLAL